MSKVFFRYFSAFVMLVLYVAVLITGDVVALTCECKYHKADEHTDFQHIHKCTQGCCSHSANECRDVFSTTYGESCSCNHSHSTEVVLYTQPRVNEISLRQTLLLATLIDKMVVLVAPSVSASFSYSEYCLPTLVSDYVGNSALRAPPVLV